MTWYIMKEVILDRDIKIQKKNSRVLTLDVISTKTGQTKMFENYVLDHS